MTTLGNERGGRAAARQATFEDRFWQLVEQARQRGVASDPVVRQQLAEAYTFAQILRFQNLQLMTALSRGRSPGTVGNGSLQKVLWSESQQRLAARAMNLLGLQSLIVGDDYGLSDWQQAFLTTRSDTIWGGTAEIQRNILAERVLGLPREPRPGT
jgi:hypothetical protein